MYTSPMFTSIYRVTLNNASDYIGHRRSHRGVMGAWAPKGSAKKICTTVLALQKGQIYMQKSYV